MSASDRERLLVGVLGSVDHGQVHLVAPLGDHQLRHLVTHVDVGQADHAVGVGQRVGRVGHEPALGISQADAAHPGTGRCAGHAAAESAAAAEAAAGTQSFGQTLTQALDGLSGMQTKADGLAVQAATGDLTNVHDYMIAATEASLATELTVAVRNKAVEAFNQIMNMGV